MGAGGPDIGISASGVYPVGEAVRCAIDLVAESGVALADLSGALTSSGVGDSLAGVLAQVGQAYQRACLDLVQGTTRLAGLLDGTVQCYLSVDQDAAYRFGRVTVHG